MIRDLDAEVGKYLLAVQQLYPACGLTVWSVWDVPIRWWDRYVAGVDEAVSAAQKRGRR